jgi:hypothetical protein
MSGLFSTNKLANILTQGQSLWVDPIYRVPPNSLAGPLRPTIMTMHELEALQPGDEVPERWRPWIAWSATSPDPYAPTCTDVRGNALSWVLYATQALHGWQVDHYPIAQCNGGRHVVGNLRALHWRVNASLGGLLGATR